MEKIITPFNKVPHLDAAVILIVGAPGIGKHQLAATLVTVNTKCALEVRIALSLPLEKDTSRPLIDFVIFMLDFANRESMTLMRKNLDSLDASFYARGKVCVVVTEVRNAMHNNVSPELVVKLAKTYRATLMSCDLQNEEDLLFVARRLMTKIELTLGIGGVSNRVLVPGLLFAPAFCVESQHQTTATRSSQSS